MPQTAVENQLCGACGAEVRPNALFCYNCGGSVSAEKVIAAPFDNGIDSAVALPEKKTDEEKSEARQISVEETSAAKKSANQKTTFVQEQSKLKSAAALRRKSKSLQPKVVEVVWAEPENAPNVWFLTVAVVLTILAIVILFTAMYLK